MDVIDFQCSGTNERDMERSEVIYQTEVEYLLMLYILPKKLEEAHERVVL